MKFPVQHTRSALIAVLLAGAASVGSAQQESKITLSRLHQSYEKHGRSSVNMPEYGRRVQFAAVVVASSPSFGGTPMVRAADVRGDRELARLTPADETQSRRMGELGSGAKINASCEVGFASGSAFLTMRACVIRP